MTDVKVKVSEIFIGMVTIVITAPPKDHVQLIRFVIEETIA